MSIYVSPIYYVSSFFHHVFIYFMFGTFWKQVKQEKCSVLTETVQIQITDHCNAVSIIILFTYAL